MVDIYGSQNEVLLQEGLEDAIDEDGFIAKLASLKPAWKVIAPGYFIVGSKIIVQKFSLNALAAREKQYQTTLLPKCTRCKTQTSKEGTELRRGSEGNSRCGRMLSKVGCILLHRDTTGNTRNWEIQASTRV